jgi:ADP-ribose pyrophosphatase
VADRCGYLDLARRYPRLFANPPGAAFHILLDEREIDRVERETGERLRARGMPAEWAQIGIVEQDQHVMKVRDAVRFPDGSTGTYTRLLAPLDGASGVVVLPIWQEQILIIRHFRHATRAWHYELPRGPRTDGLSSEENARRALEEDIGAAVIRLTSLGGMYPDAQTSTDHVELFCAEVDSYAGPEDLGDITEVHPIFPHAFAGLVADGTISDAFTLAAYARAVARHLL